MSSLSFEGSGSAVRLSVDMASVQWFICPKFRLCYSSIFIGSTVNHSLFQARGSKFHWVI